MSYGRCFDDNLQQFEKMMGSTSEIAEKTLSIFTKFAQQRLQGDFTKTLHDYANIFTLYQKFIVSLQSDPDALLDKQFDYLSQSMRLWQNFSLACLGVMANDAEKKNHHDKRFLASQWDDLPIFAFIKECYLLYSKHVQNLVTDLPTIDSKDAQKIAFYSRQFVNALSPSNFILTNPQVLEKTLLCQGQNLISGLQNMLQDLEKCGDGPLNIAMTDMAAFKVGENIGVTKGKVVFQNDLHQLIQYTPTTKQTYATPLLIIPPWINKFYILDLQAQNSLVKFLVDNGHTVFMLSWVNPNEQHATKDFSDYMLEGTLTAIKVIQEITTVPKINVLGYCLGGTLLAATLAYLRRKNYDVIESATFLATLIDFSDPGEISVFIDEAQVADLEQRMAKNGYLDGASISASFNLLRSNELIWNYYVHNYLLGEEPFPFDLLYWNCDNTNLPAAMHSFYLRKMYLENVFCKKNGVTLADTPIDITNIKAPCFFLSAVDDHIAPWQTTYLGALLPSGKVEFVLGGSGHIAGIVNPPAKNKYAYWTNKKLAPNAKQWLDEAQEHSGSWWPYWQQWLAEHSNKKIKANKPGSQKYLPLEDAPGSYVTKMSTMCKEEKCC